MTARVAGMWRHADWPERVLVFGLCPVVAVSALLIGAWPVGSGVFAAQIGWTKYLDMKAKVVDLNTELYARHVLNQILVQNLARTVGRPRRRPHVSSVRYPRGHR